MIWTVSREGFDGNVKEYAFFSEAAALNARALLLEMGGKVSGVEAALGDEKLAAAALGSCAAEVFT